MLIVAEAITSNEVSEITEKVAAAVQKVVESSTRELSRRALANVDGPRPAKLGQLTGNLYRNIAANTFVTRGGYVFSGTVGTNVLSSGFAYGAYWEGVYGLPSHNPYPRAFLKPALNEMKDKFFRDVEAAVQRVF